MAYFAKIDDSNLVTQVVVTDDNKPAKGYVWLVERFGGSWVECSIDGSIRKNYPGVGFTYDESRDAFISPKPYESWILNEGSCTWEPPISYPSKGAHEWDEDSLSWIEVDTTGE